MFGKRQCLFVRPAIRKGEGGILLRHCRMPTSLRANHTLFLSIAIKPFVSDTKTRSDHGDKWDRVSELPIGGLTLNYHYDNVLPSKQASGKDSYQRSISLYVCLNCVLQLYIFHRSKLICRNIQD